MIRTIPFLALALLSCTASPSLPVSGPPMARSPGAALGAQIVSLHNAERARVGAAPVIWDPLLASDAQAYAYRIARLGRLVHSSKSERGRTGENLWMGTRGAFPIETMVGTWIAEKRLFRPGLFPHNSITGNWTDVGHYTAMIWPTTTRIGCGVGTAGGNEVLVCRYSPGGNIDGRRVP